MKKSTRAHALFVLAAFLCVACDSGSSDDDLELELDPITEESDTTKSELRSPLTTDTLPAPAGTAWYRFANNYYDMALTGTTMTYTDTTFEELTYWWDGDSWEKVIGLKGTLANKSGSEFDATLTDIYLLNETGGGSWYASGSDEFKGYIGFIWSKAGDATARVSYAETGSSLSCKRDQSGDDDLVDTIDIKDSYGKTNFTTLTGHGRYPFGGWASLSIGGGTEASSSIELHSAFPDDFDNSAESLIKSISATIKNQNGHGIGPVDYAWEPDATDEDGGDWEHEYNIGAYTDGGIWYLKTYTILWKNGAKSTYTAADPWSKYAVTYVTDTGYEGTMTATDIRVGQDYKAPATPGAGREFRYVRTLPNKSSAEDDDMEMYLYKEGDTDHWIAANDDWFSEAEGGYSTICYPVEASTKYYVKVVELNKEKAAYSIVLRNKYDLDTIRTDTLLVDVTTDSEEDDDVPANAKTMNIDTPLHRIYDIDDPDWFTFTTPASWP
jgi:hypothetical protein